MGIGKEYATESIALNATPAEQNQDDSKLAIQNLNSAGSKVDINPEIAFVSGKNVEGAHLSLDLDPNQEPESNPQEVPVTYPEGGLEAWLVVFGCWCGIIASVGMTNVMGTYQAYLAENQLKEYNEGEIGWIFSIYTFLAFFCSIYCGPIFDKHGPRWLVLVGSVCIVAELMIFSVCTKFWQFILVFSVLGGLGSALLFTPSVAAVGHFFNTRRGNATGIVATSGAVGGIIFPLMLQSLLPRVGFGWSTRIFGFVVIALCLIAFLLIKSRLPPLKNASIHPDLKILKEPVFGITVVGVFLLEWGLFGPLTYITSFAIQQGFSQALSYQILPILNAGSVFGRWIPGYIADYLGRYNTIIISIVINIISVFGIWLTIEGSSAALIIFALLFGFSTGGNLGLIPVCVGQLCRTETYGRYYATCYTIVSFGCLSGIPIAGWIIASNGGSYFGVIIFTGVCYVGALVAFVAVRLLVTGWEFLYKF